MDYFIDLDKYYPSIKTKMSKIDFKNVIAKMATISTVATNGASTYVCVHVCMCSTFNLKFDTAVK